MRLTRLKMVVLPAPLGPMMVKTSPLLTSKLTPSTALMPPKWMASLSAMSFFTADKLAIHFGGIKAVDGVSFEVSKGEVFTIIGPNGAGKTTIFNLVSRIYEPSAGRLTFDGMD